MSFISLEFFACLAIAGTVFYFVPARLRVLYLLALSYLFYLTWSWAYLVLMVLVTAATYAAGRAIAATPVEQRKQLYLGLGVAAMIVLVVTFKLLGQIQGILFPLGLSYYSFKLIAYLVDVYWDERAVATDAPAFFLYPAFFPQIVSGPIQRADDFFSQLRTQAMGPADYERIESGFRLILGGLMLKMLVGDRLGAFIAAVDAAPASYNHGVALTLACCYTLQLYADFAGYTNIAIGIGRVFGIDSPRNFNAPFAASNMQELWRRWHMTLTSWVTDYLFMPLQLALRDLGRISTVIGLTLSMVVIGLWHNITWNFLAFGLCHAVFVTVTAFTAKQRTRLFGGRRPARWIGIAVGILITFALFTFSMLFWRTHGWADAMTHIKLVFGLTPAGTLGMRDIRFDVSDPVFICMAVAFYVGAGTPGARLLLRGVDRFVPNFVQYGVCLLLLSALTIESGSSFIYGQF